MALQKIHYFSTVVVFFASLFFPSYDALEFDVGGNDGWVLNPSESYNHWAARMRFQVNDTLLFRYEKGRESVLEVDEEDYEKCNVENPMKKMDDGYSVLKLDRSGPFYFISGIQQNCENGQKIVVVVLAPKHHNAPPPPPPSTGGDAPPKGCSSTASPAGVAPWASPHRPSAAPPKGPSPSDRAPAGSPPAFNAPAKPPAPAGTPEPPSPMPSSPDFSETPLPTIPVSPAKSPPAGGGCNGSSIRSDPANVHNSPASSPPQSTLDTYEDCAIGQLRNELGDAKAALGGASNVEGESEGGQDHLYWELENVPDLVAIALSEEGVMKVSEFLHLPQHTLRALRHWSRLKAAELQIERTDR
nr:early nodulin-like protein 2 [Ipomoea batatas]